MTKNIVILLMAIFLSSCSNGQEKTTKNKLSATEFAQQIASAKDIQLIDVRTPGEFEKGHIANAININIGDADFDKRIAKLDKSKPTYVYCLSGGRTVGAVEKLHQAGFENVIEMPGGMMEWRANSLPESKGTTATTTGMTMAQYEALLKTDKLVLIDFYADWCAPCKKMEPYLNRMAKEMTDKVVVVRIDADANTDLCKALNVAGLPVLKLYKNKQIIWEKNGFADEQEVMNQLQ